MVGRNFATLSLCVLFLFSTQVERAHTPNFDASEVTLLKVQNNPNLPPVSEQTNQRLPETPSISASKRKTFRDILAMPLNFPATRFISLSHQIKTLLEMRPIQQNCLTTAVYFEARSESTLGQLAVATVILNRVQTSNFSICGVVYKGANRFNACQFSFACDGKPDHVNDARAWKTAIEVTNLAIAGDTTIMGGPMQVLAGATNYHADYVNPNWSKSLTRLTQIGRHIFYSQSPAGGPTGSRKNYI